MKTTVVLEQSYDCPMAIEITLEDMGKSRNTTKNEPRAHI